MPEVSSLATVLLMIVSTLVTVGCDSSSPEDEPPEPQEPQLVETDLISLEGAREWSYDFSTYSGTQRRYYRTDGDTTVGGETYRLLHIQDEGEKGTTHLLRYDGEGLVWADADAEKRYYFLYPDDESGTFTDSIYTVREFSNVVYKAFLVEEDVTVETPAGTYSGCLKYRHFQEDKRTGETTLTKHFWFKPELGIVKRDYVSSLASTNLELVSTSF